MTGGQKVESSNLSIPTIFLPFFPYCLEISLSQKRQSGVANFVCRRLVFLLFALFKRSSPVGLRDFLGSCRAPLRLRPASLRRQVGSCRARLRLVPHGSSSLRSLSNLSIPTIFFLCTLAHLAPCSVVRSVEYAGTLLRSLPSQNATCAQTASQKGVCCYHQGFHSR